MRFIPYAYIGYPYHPQWQAYYPQTVQNQEFQFPPVDTETLHVSAEKFQTIMKEARLLIDKMIDNPSFSKDLMSAAQLSNEKKVLELIRSTGVTVNVSTQFTPTGIQIEFDNSESDMGCCKLNINLLW